MGKFGESVRELSILLGDEPDIRFAGLVKGSAVLRAFVPAQAEQAVQVRLLQAKTVLESEPAEQVQKMGRLLGRDGLRAELLDRNSLKVLEFKGIEAANDSTQEVVVHDTGTVDGIVVGIEGADDTVHVRLRDINGTESRIILRDISQAQELARRFRGQIVRVHVHGTWKRMPDGIWAPNRLYADRFEDLDETPALEVFERLRAIPGNGWAEVEEPMNAWRGLREGS